jgi:hypothetical protein
MAMYCDVQGPMPGKRPSFSTVAASVASARDDDHLRNLLNGARDFAGHSKPGERCGPRFDYRSGRRRNVRQYRIACFEGLAVRRHDPVEHAQRRLGFECTAHEEREGDLEAVERARYSQAGKRAHHRAEPTLREMQVDHGRLGIEVEEVPEPREQRHQRGHERWGDIHR